MDTAQFLARVVPSQGFITIGVNRTPGQDGGFFNRMFQAGDYAGAAGFARWASRKGWDAYHANASFRVAATDGPDDRGNQKWKGSRKGDNAQVVRAFWIDLDVKRAGDKKAPASVFPTQRDAVAWLGGFIQATGLPRPNLGVVSGYGLHVYWLIEDAMPPADWQPYADALKAAMLKHSFTGDAGITSDVARVLRPPGTVNAKALPHMPVTVIASMSRGDYPNQLVLSKLQPYLGLVQRTISSTTVAASSAAGAVLAGGSNVTSIFTAAGATQNMAAAAQANLTAPPREPREFSRIATGCQQVASSLASRGNGDTYQTWYLGHLTLAHFCVDGAAYVHPIGDGDSKYTQAGTDTAVARIAQEHARNGFGPPSCASYNSNRQGICGTCPHFGKITTPWDLGRADGDLPDNYRRNGGRLEVVVADNSGKKVEFNWVPFLHGDVHSPLLYEVDGGDRELLFSFDRARRNYAMSVRGEGLAPDATSLFKHLTTRGMTLLPGSEQRMRGFLLAWIDALRERRAERGKLAEPFGWARDPAGKVDGFAVGGDLYRKGGVVERLPIVDRQMATWYKPVGDIDEWKKAAAFVTRGRPDLQMIVANSFGAPLMEFTGHRGVLFSAWSSGGGAGKSAAMTVSTAVWACKESMFSLDDTGNSKYQRLGIIRALPAGWDEARISNDRAASFVNEVFNLSQGKGKGRLDANASVRPVGHWKTILTICSNRPVMDHMVAEDEGTDAGALRVFEWQITHPRLPQDPHAAVLIAQCETNYGSAGRVYIQWVIDNLDAVRAAVLQQAEWFVKHLQCGNEERLFIAGMAVSLIGAKIATKLGLVPFDLPALRDFMCKVLLDLRAARARDVVVTANGYDLTELFGRFLNDHALNKIVTDRFVKGGRQKVHVAWQPHGREPVYVHVSQQDQAIRVSKQALTTWLRKRRFAASDVIDAMQKQWSATSNTRVTLAGGTGWVTAQTYVVEIPIQPTLADLLYLDPSVAAAMSGPSPQAQGTP